ncbi:MAG: polysaccharide deacetylase family protein [bacterium]|nr:polysaccharide deacetylase family protein [bacterium]
MLKKAISYFGVFVLVCFSFFYTDQAVDIIRRNDPIMKKIVENSKSLEINPMNAVIQDDEIITGLNGLKVNIDKSYQNMKKINRYQESMLVFDEVTPEVPIQYDKYVVQGNETKNQVALVFKVEDITNLEMVNSILEEKNSVATFFMDGYFVQNNMDLVSEFARNGYEIENLGYEGVYSSQKLKWTNNMIESLTYRDVKYCYTEYKDSTILDLCSSHKMYTIKPTINTSNYPFLTIKKNLESGSIISFDLSNKVVKELPSIISYILQKGYQPVLLSQLLSEDIANEK